MEQPLVSILCGCYNQSKFIVESLESIKNQTYKNYEVIIWDDASTDNSVGIIENWFAANPEIAVQFIKHETNIGICKSLNECFKASKGKYIQMLALDDILLSHKLERHVEILERSKPTEALVFSDAYLIDDNSALYQNLFIAFHYHYLSLQSGNYFEILVHRNFIPAMSVLLKREVIEDVGYWDENLPFEDHDMWLRISKNYDFLFDDKISVKYRMHENNSHKKINFTKPIFYMLAKHLEIRSVQKKLQTYIIEKYMDSSLSDEHIIYFKQITAKGMKERLIKQNKGRLLYRILYKLGIH